MRTLLRTTASPNEDRAARPARGGFLLSSLSSLPSPVSALALALLAAGCGAGSSAAPSSETSIEAKPGPSPEGDTGHEGPHSAAHGHRHGHGEGGPLVHRFERAEDWVPDFDDPGRDAWQKPAAVVAAMHIDPGMTVADLGAGTGYFLPHLSRAVGPNGKVLALDVEPDMVRYMTERAAREHLANVTARKVPYDDPELPAGSVDRILIVDTWHHIPDRPQYAAKLAVALRPSGAVILVDFTKDAQRGPPREHRIAAEDAAAELIAGGLTAELVEEELPDQYIVIGKRR